MRLKLFWSVFWPFTCDCLSSLWLPFACYQKYFSLLISLIFSTLPLMRSFQFTSFIKLSPCVQDDKRDKLFASETDRDMSILGIDVTHFVEFRAAVIVQFCFSCPLPSRGNVYCCWLSWCFWHQRDRCWLRTLQVPVTHCPAALNHFPLFNCYQSYCGVEGKHGQGPACCSDLGS